VTGPAGPTGVLVVTGTGTGVGKTVVTAAIAALARAAGRHVAVVKPAQTGVDSDIPDIDTVTALSGVTDTHELARFPDPLSPEAAARVSGLPPLDVAAAADYVAKLATERDLVIVEGAGGLLVRYDPAGSTLADLASDLNGRGLAAPLLLVTAAGLGTLNHTALTGEALSARGLTCTGVVVGSWPGEPGLGERQNLADLPVAAGVALAGVLPEGAGSLPPHEFLRVARANLAPHLGGARRAG